MSRRQCIRKDCPKVAVGRGLCANHLKQWTLRQRAYGRFDNDRRPVDAPQQRLRELRDAGIGLRQIQALTGLERVTLYKLMDPGRHWCSSRTHDLILAIPAAAPHQLANPNAFIDSTGTIRRLRALARIGYGGTQVTQLLGIADRTALGTLYTGKAKKITAGKALAISELFDTLEMTEGPSRIARDRAIKKGWPLPLQWDEDTIDDPAAKPIEGSNYSPFKERLEELHDMGIRDVNEIAERLDQKPESVKRQLERIKAASNKDSAA